VRRSPHLRRASGNESFFDVEVLHLVEYCTHDSFDDFGVEHLDPVAEVAAVLGINREVELGDGRLRDEGSREAPPHHDVLLVLGLSIDREVQNLRRRGDHGDGSLGTDEAAVREPHVLGTTVLQKENVPRGACATAKSDQHSKPLFSRLSDGIAAFKELSWV